MFDPQWYPIISHADKIPVLYPDVTNFDLQKQQFLTNQIENPDFIYQDIDPNTLAVRTSRLRNLQKDLLISEKNPTVQALYSDKIEEELRRVDLYQAVLDKDIDQFSEATTAVFGHPQLSIWQPILGRLQKRKKFSATETPLLYQLLANSHSSTQDSTDLSMHIPSQADLDNLLQALYQRFPFLQLKNLDNDLDANAITQVFTQALIGIGAKEWRCEILEGSRAAICVMNRRKIVGVPSSRVVPATEITKLIVHEIGTHVYRSTNAESSPLQLLRFGLDHYLAAEEGLATCNEQILSGKFKDFSGDDKYFAIGLVFGLDGVKRDFRATYEIMKEYYHLKYPSKTQEQISTKAWTLCVRIFRGTPAAHKGVCYTKDIVYRDGNIKIWQLLLKDPQFYPHLFLGKYDPTKTKHLQALHDLGVLN